MRDELETLVMQQANIVLETRLGGLSVKLGSYLRSIHSKGTH